MAYLQLIFQISLIITVLLSFSYLFSLYINRLLVNVSISQKHEIISKTNKATIVLLLILVMLITIISMLMPVFLLIMNLFSAIFVLFLLFESLPQLLFKEDVIRYFLYFLKKVNILNQLYNIHSYIFIHASNRIFMSIFIVSNMFHIIYIYLARYYVYITLFTYINMSWAMLYMIAICLFITYLGLINRIVVNTINIVIMTCYNRYPSLLLTDPIDTPPSDTPNILDNMHPLVSSTKQNNMPHIPPVLPERVNIWVKGGVICSIVATAGACGALYYFHKQNVIAQYANVLAEEANRKSEEANVKAEQANRKAEEANRLKRIEMAKADSSIAPIVFKNHPSEHTDFKFYQNQQAWTDYDKKRDSWAQSPWYRRGKPPIPPSDPRS